MLFNAETICPLVPGGSKPASSRFIDLSGPASLNKVLPYYTIPYHTIPSTNVGFTYGHQGARAARDEATELTARLVCNKDVTLQYTFLAISPVFGLVYHTTQVGARTGALFNQFLKNTNEPLDENETHYLILDGAPPIVEQFLPQIIPKFRFCHHTLHF